MKFISKFKGNQTMPITYPMYFPPEPFDLDTAIMCNKLVNTAYDMQQQWE